MPDVVLSGVTLDLDGVEALSGVDLRVPSGSIAVVIGPSGSGKTSLLRLVAGLETPTEGTVSIGSGQDGETPVAVSMVSQADDLYEHLDVAGNLRFPLEVAGVSDEVAERVSRSTAARSGVAGLWRRRASSLSGGERGVVAAAHAASRPGLQLLVLDEPLVRADVHLRRRFRDDLRRLHDERELTTVLATSDHDEALALADVLVVMDRGRVIQSGSPGSVLESPDSTDVASFVGRIPMNLFPARLRREGGDGIVEIGKDRIRLGRFPPDLDGDLRVVVGLRAHELYVAPPGTPFDRVLHVTVGRVDHTGSGRAVLFGLGNVSGGTFVMNEYRPAAVRPGDRLELTWAPDRARLFRADTGLAIPM